MMVYHALLQNQITLERIMAECVELYRTIPPPPPPPSGIEYPHIRTALAN